MTDFPSVDFLHHIDGSCYQQRAQWRELSKDPLFTYKYEPTLHDQREAAYKRLKKIADSNIVSVYDFNTNPLNIFAAHEMISLIDGSLATKFTVQFNLFGGSMLCLGSERHSSIVKGIDSLKVVGCFALTELGFGNNAVEMQTTAIFDAKTKEFIINNPTHLSQKYWITNGALHANYAVVFAQLYMPSGPKGELKKEGINTFVVRLRNDDMSLRTGVFIEDMGFKLGANGVDNARIAFNNVRVPQDAILNRFSDVNQQGQFVSSIPKMRDRFLRVADRLLSGRLCIAGLCMFGTRMVLINGMRYAKARMVLGEDGKSSSPIIDFQLWQNATYPLLAKTIVLGNAYNRIKEIYAKDIFTTDSQIIRYCCFIKPMISWNLRDTSATLVERCGGQGYLQNNRMCEGIGLGHSGITAEGDNSVLMQKVTKELMTDFQTGKFKLPQLTECPKRQISTYDSVANLETIFNILKYREQLLIQELGNTTAQKMGEGQSIYQIWMRDYNDLVQAVAHSHAERLIFEFNYNDIKTAKPCLRDILSELLLNYGLNILKRELGWLLSNEIINQKAGKNVLVQLQASTKKIHKYSLSIVNSFGIPEHLLTSPVATNYELFNALPWLKDGGKAKL